MSSNIGCESPKLQVTRPVHSKVSRASISSASHSQSVTGTTALTLGLLGIGEVDGWIRISHSVSVIFTNLSRIRLEATLRDTGMGLGKYLRYLPDRWMDEQWQFIIQPCLLSRDRSEVTLRPPCHVWIFCSLSSIV